MKIGGLQKTTLLDYPGKVAAIVFTQGCSFRCFFCHNPELVIPEQFGAPLSEDDFFEFLKKRQGLLDGIVITGGEPTIQPDILEFMKKIKALGFLIKLDTNGSRPEVLEQALKEKLVDYLAMDIKAPLERYKELVGVEIDAEKIKKSIGLVINSGLDYEFRSTLVPGFHTKDDVLKMAAMIKGAKKYYLQKFVFSGKIVDQGWAKRGEFADREMEEFKNIVAPLVEECAIRA